VDHATLVSGLAATTAIDLKRMAFRAYAFDNVGTWVRQLPPLLFRHGEPAGTIDSLYYDAVGNLRITATVTHSEAARCGGFSVGATIHSYELKNADSPSGYHALVTRASITEVSLTPQPCNPQALVTDRIRAPQLEHYTLTGQAITKVIQIVELLQKWPRPAAGQKDLNSGQKDPAMRSMMPTEKDRRRSFVRPTPFSQLISQLPTGGD
jgi:hypothetical protein